MFKELSNLNHWRYFYPRLKIKMKCLKGEKNLRELQQLQDFKYLLNITKRSCKHP